MTYKVYENYDKEFVPGDVQIIFPPHIHEKIVSYLTGNILDIGPGDGCKLENLLNRADERELNITCLEPSIPLHKKLQQRFKNNDKMSIYQGYLEENPFKEHSFDTILMFEVLEHLQDQDRCLREVVKLLNPKGIFICSTPNKWVYRILARLNKEEMDPTHISELTYRGYWRLLKKYFEEVFFMGNFPWMGVFRKFPGAFIINKHINFAPIARTVYGFAGKPREVCEQ